MAELQSDQNGSPGRLAARLLDLPAPAQFGFWFVIILLAKAGSLFEPPVWDAAMGVFPPAIFLHESGFDIRELLQQGNWWQGGPNVHSLSLFTWFLAAVMSLTNSATMTFAIVHVVTYGLVAYALVLFSRALKLDGITAPAILSGTCLLLFLPLVLVQVGYLYTETWVMAFSIGAWAHWREGRVGIAVAIGAVALFIKLTGIAIAACVGAALVLSLLRAPRSRARWILVPVLPLALLGVRALPKWLGAAPVPGPSWGDPDFLGRALIERLGAIPDITLLLALGMFSSLAYAALRLRPGAEPFELRTPDPAVGGRLICLAVPFVFAAGMLASIFSQILFLPRYLVPAIPFSIAAILILAHTVGRDRLVTIGLTAFSCLALLNFDGRFYSPEFGTFSVVERSHAYKKFHQVQMELIDAIERAPERLPVYVSKELDYMLSHPMMGYVDRKMPQVRALYAADTRGRSIDEYPPEFLLAYSNPRHGGEEAARLAQAAQIRPDIELRVRRFEHDGFHTTLFWVRREGAPPVPDSDAADRNVPPQGNRPLGVAVK